MKIIQIVLLIITLSSCYAQNKPDGIPIEDIKYDLQYLDNFISEKSSYSGLNGFSYQEAFDTFLKVNNNRTIAKNEFGMFLSKIIGQLGDRHANVRGFKLPNTKYLSIAFAPHKENVLVLEFDTTSRQYKIFNPSFPVLKALGDMLIEELLPKVLPGELSAPKNAYFTRGVRELRDIEEIYTRLGKDLPDPIEVVLSNYENSKDTTIQLSLVDGKKRRNKWDEKFYRKFFYLKEEEFNQIDIIQQLFRFEENIGYVRIPDMVGKDEAPAMFDYFNQFMNEVKGDSEALIIDVRSNGGGVRDLIYEMAGYFVHPDSVYIVNAVRQRGALPLNQDLKESLHHRFLLSIDELDAREKMAVKRFNSVFKPMFELDDDRYSQFYYAVFNGQKLSKGKFYYNKPIYILANERSFSAASVLVALFKGLPNVKVVGVTTDGSSGNSKRFELPKTKIRGKISTMVSFQKDGKILDGYGTEPDSRIERDVSQILWKSDTQLEKVIEMIKNNNH